MVINMNIDKLEKEAEELGIPVEWLVQNEAEQDADLVVPNIKGIFGIRFSPEKKKIKKFNNKY